MAKKSIKTNKLKEKVEAISKHNKESKTVSSNQAYSFNKSDANNGDASKFALGKINYTLIAIAFAFIILGFALMAGESSTPDNYNPDIFSWRRIVLGPTISFIGFVSIVFAIMYKGKNKEGGK